MMLGVGACVASAQPPQTAPPAPPPATEPKPAPSPVPAPPAGQMPLVSTSETPAAVVPALLAPLAGADLKRRREAIDAMEGMLPTRVRSGAKDTMDQMQAVQPGMNLFTTSAPRARGFHLEGYGVFFYVEIPGVRPSVASIVEQLQRERERNERGSASRAAAGSGPVSFDPNAVYTEAVKRQLIDALLDWSGGLDLRPSEWLTIAARDGDEPIPNVIYESITMVIRVRGADLADFRAGRISRPEMLKRVEVRGF
ncbi:MAG: hypothetical protein ABIQ52_00010 [Vicinamibacterales bacterium]